MRGDFLFSGKNEDFGLSMVNESERGKKKSLRKKNWERELKREIQRYILGFKEQKGLAFGGRRTT